MGGGAILIMKIKEGFIMPCGVHVSSKEYDVKSVEELLVWLQENYSTEKGKGLNISYGLTKELLEKCDKLELGNVPYFSADFCFGKQKVRVAELPRLFFRITRYSKTGRPAPEPEEVMKNVWIDRERMANGEALKDFATKDKFIKEMKESSKAVVKEQAD